MKYTPVIGLEVHVELKTESKMFCRCSADYFGHDPNTHTCPVCLGLPGALPVPNKKAIEWCVMIGMALNCKIPLYSKFDRKNYFYPDLPKGYQISQYDEPFAINGSLKIKMKNEKLKTVRVRRVHMEEDTGKLTHAVITGKQASLIDFNRSGVPLVEIVTEPDFESAEEVVAYLKKLQQIVRYLKVSNADMEKGDMRLEPNISLRARGTTELPKYKVEVKNINSFRFVDRSIQFEIKRQTEILEKGETPAQETRGWNETKNATVSQRSKEEAHDYRYFPEPDIPPITWKEGDVERIRSSMPELIDAKLARFEKDFSLPRYDAEILTRENETADYFEEAVRVGKEHNVTPKQIANAIINKNVDTATVLPAALIEEIKQSSQTAQIDPDTLAKFVEEVLKENSKAVEEYKAGKETVLQFLIGQVLKKAKQKIDINLVKNGILDKI